MEQLKGIRCPSTIKQKGLKVLSCRDAIARLIEKVEQMSNDTGSIDTQMGEEKEEATVTVGPGTSICPECGSKVEHEGGCVICRSCGYSKCG